MLKIIVHLSLWREANVEGNGDLYCQLVTLATLTTVSLSTVPRIPLSLWFQVRVFQQRIYVRFESYYQKSLCFFFFKDHSFKGNDSDHRCADRAQLALTPLYSMTNYFSKPQLCWPRESANPLPFTWLQNHRRKNLHRLLCPHPLMPPALCWLDMLDFSDQLIVTSLII